MSVPSDVKVSGTIMSRGVELAVVAIVVGGVVSLVTFSILGVVGFAVAIALVMLIARAFSGVVEVDEGRVVATSKNGKVVTIAWSEPHDCFVDGVRGFVGPMPLGTSCSLRLVAGDGRRIVVQSVRGKNGAVVSAIRRSSTRALLPVIRARLAAGETVPFGPVQLSRAVLTAGGTRYPLSEIAETSISDGSLRVKGEGRWLGTRIALKRIANYESLLVAIDELRS
jgi:hypothetical protein